MRRFGSDSSSIRLVRGGLLALILLAPATVPEAHAQGWPGYGNDAQHSCVSATASQLPQVVKWSLPVDLNPPFSGNDLYIHYASPIITRKNSVIVTTRTDSGFQINAVRGQDGTHIWQKALTTDYVFPPYNWVPVCGSTLALHDQQLVIPGAGGTVYMRTTPDLAIGGITQVAFYGLNNYQAHKASFNESVFICTPITADSNGNLYFGFVVTQPNPLSTLTKGGLARISARGEGTWVSAAAATGDSSMQKVVYNCAPALSPDESTVYVAVNDQLGGDGISGSGYLVGLNSTTLSAASAKKVRLKDVRTGGDALLPDDGSATPTVGPDGDVYMGVLEANLPYGNNDRGWLLHFSGDLATKKTPGSFGWDDTASIVPAEIIRSYKGTSKYLLLTKYNDYADFGFAGGQNRLAILDPNAFETYYPYQATQPVLVMKEVQTVLGVTPNTDDGLPGVREWCINSAAIDTVNKCAIVNSEDGHVYRWDFGSNMLTMQLALAQATGEAYTPTVIGPDGAVYAINRAVLNCCVAKPK